MRKILSLVLVLSMVLGSFGFAFAAPADVEGTDFEDAVTRLAALDVLSGFPDGTFRPDETVTRAQFAKIMANALGVGTAAQYAHGATKFADVPADHWAAGYINVVSDMKIVNGYGDGNFGPEDQVTYAEAITMIVRSLGYEPKAKAIGGYPGGYIAIGAEEDITDDINVINTLAANRGDVALMVDASLTVPMMYQKTWGQYPEYANDDEDKTLMKTKLGVDEVSGVVTAIPNTDSTLDADEIKIDGDKYDVLVENFQYDKLLGLEVTVWEDGGDILDFDIDTDEDDILFDTMTASTEDDVTLYVDDSTYDWADKAKVYVNFEEVDVDEDLDLTNAYGYAVLNEKEEVTYVNAFDFDEVAVGVVYDVNEDEYSYVEPSKDTDELELSDFEDGVFIYNEKMELVDADEIAVNSAIFAWETSDELYLIVKNEVVEGTLERVKAAEVKVDGTSYDASRLGAVYSDDGFDNFEVYDAVADLDNLGDEAVVAALDLSGELLLIHGDAETTSSTMYGLVTYGEVGSKAEVTVFTKDGEEVDYVFESRTDGGSANIEHENYYEVFRDNDGNDLKFEIVKYKLNSDGEIDASFVAGDDIKTVLYDNDAVDGAVPGGDGDLTKDADKNYVKIDGATKYYIDEDTIFMTAVSETSTTGEYELDPAVISYEDVYESGIAATEVVYFADSNDRELKLVVFLNPAFTGADDDVYYGVVTDSPWKDGSDYVAKIDVFDKGEEEYIVADSADFTEGKVVAFKYNTDNEIVLVADGGTKADYDDDQGIAFDYDDGYVTLDNDGDIKVASGAVIYSLDVYTDDDGALDTSKGNNAAKNNGISGIDEEDKITNIDDFNNVLYVLDDDGILVAAVVYKLTAVTPETEWALALTDDVDAVDAGITVAITAPAGTDLAADYVVGIYEGAATTPVKVITAGASVEFVDGASDDLDLAKVYTVKVMEADGLKVVVEKSIANIQ